MKSKSIICSIFLQILCLAGQIHAQDLSISQRILMPGPLTSAHAELESKCENCHVSFAQEESSSLCLGCHEVIASDRSTNSGFHGQSLLASTAKCDTCHTEHEGRNADILNFIPADFNHIPTRFQLTGSHEDLDCTGCHFTDEGFRDAPVNCAGCHQDQDIHRQVLGDDCESCHQTTSWRERLPFDHEVTGFTLDGAHETADCISCHLDQQFAFEDTSCNSCHAVADIHSGNNGVACESCHITQSWEITTFDHEMTMFPLLGRHSDANCISCHIGGDTSRNAPTECSGCHLPDDIHFGRNGNDCNNCHVSDGWLQVTFDHELIAGYALSGKHAEAECTHCHIGDLDQPLSQDCATCHVADDVHFDQAMYVCDSCHVTDDWHSVDQFDHDFSQFPLLGLHRVVTCENCHFDQQFMSTDPDCVGCHQNEDRHAGSLGLDCAGCHSPNGWDNWQFDHLEFSGYALVGSHDQLSCDSCHVPDTDPAETATGCSSCHISEDIHRGEFGTDCGQCHTSVSFSEILSFRRRQ